MNSKQNKLWFLTVCFTDIADTIPQQPSFIYQTLWWQLSNMFSTHFNFALLFANGVKDLRIPTGSSPISKKLLHKRQLIRAPSYYQADDILIGRTNLRDVLYKVVRQEGVLWYKCWRCKCSGRRANRGERSNWGSMAYDMQHCSVGKIKFVSLSFLGQNSCIQNE